jgi:hypothetical protein
MIKKDQKDQKDQNVLQENKFKYARKYYLKLIFL